jgi:hypothetical protein
MKALFVDDWIGERENELQPWISNIAVAATTNTSFAAMMWGVLQSMPAIDTVRRENRSLMFDWEEVLIVMAWTMVRWSSTTI